MPSEFRGEIAAGERRFAIVASRFNQYVTDLLLAGAIEGFHAHGVPDDHVDVASVPGAVEIPLVAKKLAQSGKYAAIVCVGAVIQGETAHFEHVGRVAAEGTAAVSRETGIPVLFGVLTTYTVEQAKARAGGELGNRGYDAAVNALEMADLIARLGR